MDAERIKYLQKIAQQSGSEYAARTRPQTTGGAKKKGFWQDQISTGGGIGGALVGGAAGAAAGSVLPGVGTVIGGLAGAILGGGAGGAAGQVVENSLTGERDLSKDVLKEGALNAAFSLGPIRGLSIAAKGGSALARGAGATGLREAVEAGATATPIRNFIGGKLGNAGANLQRGVANTTKVADSFTEEKSLLDALNRNGLHGSAARQYQNIDGAISSLSTKIGDELAAVGTSAPRKTVISNLQKSTAELLPSDNTYVKELTRSLERLSKSSDGAVGPKELFAFKKELNARLSNAFGKLQRGSPLTAKEEVDMALWRQLDKQITALAPKVKQMTLDQSRLITARPGLQKGAEKTAGIPILGIKSRGAEKVIQGTQDLSGRALQGASSVRLPGTGLSPLRMGARMGAAGAVFNPGGAPDMENEQPLDDPMSQGINQPISLDQALLGADIPQQPTNPFSVSQEQVAQQMVLALQNGDTKGFSQLQAMYEMIGEYEKANAPSSLNPSKPTTVEGQKAYNNAMSGLNAISELEGMLARDGGLTWKSALPGGSLTDAMLGASQYETALMTAADSMARLRTGAAMTKEETKNFKAMLPQAGDSAETVAYKLNNFRSYFNEVLNQPQGGYAPSTLEEALQQMQ